MKKSVSIGIFASGNGSNAESIIRACEENTLPAHVSVIISNHPDAKVLQRAQQHGIPAFVVNRKDFPDGIKFAGRLADILESHGVDLILLAGYLRKLPPAITRRWRQAVLNIHPALLPKHGGKGMYGIRVHQSVLDHSDPFTGVTVHFVNEKYDEGDIFLQSETIPVNGNDTAESLASRVLKVEHRIYPEAVKQWIDIYYNDR